MITSSYERSYFQPLCILRQSDSAPEGPLESIPSRISSEHLASQPKKRMSNSVEAALEAWLVELISSVSVWLGQSSQFQIIENSPLASSDQSSAIFSAIGLIKQFEGLSLTAYQDSGKVWTIGYGSTQGVFSGMQISQEEAQLLLFDEVKRVSSGVMDLVKVPLTSHEQAALISFAYNVGLGSFKNSTLLRFLNGGYKAEAAEEILKWVYCNNEKLPGLMRRRDAEYRLFLSQ